MTLPTNIIDSGFAIFTIVFSIVTPLWGLWDVLFKRQPYISEVRKGVEF